MEKTRLAPNFSSSTDKGFVTVQIHLNQWDVQDKNSRASFCNYTQIKRQPSLYDTSFCWGRKTTFVLGMRLAPSWQKGNFQTSLRSHGSRTHDVHNMTSAYWRHVYRKLLTHHRSFWWKILEDKIIHWDVIVHLRWLLTRVRERSEFWLWRNASKVKWTFMAKIGKIDSYPERISTGRKTSPCRIEV